MKNGKLLKAAVILVDFALALLVFCTVALPWGVTWYVETMGRSQKLPAIIMATCYPCVPFAGTVLYFLRRLLKNIGRGEIWVSDNRRCVNRAVQFLLVIALITAVGGRFYLPFFIVGISTAFMALILFIIKAAVTNVAPDNHPSDGEE